jgi:regulatory protein YycI of two-component signal transduction system YycFG
MNQNSSRSHAILNIFLEQIWVEKQATNQQSFYNQQEHEEVIKKRHYRKALLTIVDLAGSERLNKTGSELMRLKEA